MTTGSREPESGGVWTPLLVFFFFFLHLFRGIWGHTGFFFSPQYCTIVYITFVLGELSYSAHSARVNRISQSLIESRVRVHQFFSPKGNCITTQQQGEKKMFYIFKRATKSSLIKQKKKKKPASKPSLFLFYFNV